MPNLSLQRTASPPAELARWTAMGNLRLNIVRDGSPFGLVATLEGQEHPGIFLPAGVVESLKELVRRAELDDGDAESVKSLIQFLHSVLAPHGAFTQSSAPDIRTALEELRKMAAQLGGGGDDDGPKRA